MRETMVIPSAYRETASQQFATSGKSFQLLLARLVRIGCLLIASVGAAVLCGWIFDIPQLTRLLPGLAFMKINTACALLAWHSGSCTRVNRGHRGFLLHAAWPLSWSRLAALHWLNISSEWTLASINTSHSACSRRRTLRISAACHPPHR